MITDYKVYTVEEVANSLGMNSRTIREYIRNGQLNASRIGRKYIISQDDYKAFVSGDHKLNNKEEL
ncbi:helix-turn-helix domain-containing protein [Staphylococcus xylosus]|uniref:helix-turn-helix domain-containing protein n=1 Tax=Staphylococcus xylosus TaxID=1288 RepID=UPI002DBD31AB|nr:helix-turn-helix domain-containing protein [Staphylococcus xylosus]MEB7812819.1 helix-turn-helix domain-containing protein [Staphylococcus xylosus]